MLDGLVETWKVEVSCVVEEVEVFSDCAGN